MFLGFVGSFVADVIVGNLCLGGHVSFVHASVLEGHTVAHLVGSRLVSTAGSLGRLEAVVDVLMHVLIR